MRYVRPTHFSEGVWAPDGPLRFARYTCLLCGRICPTWEAFKAHRPACSARLWATGPQGPQGPQGRPPPLPPELPEADLDPEAAAILAELLRQVDEGATAEA